MPYSGMNIEIPYGKEPSSNSDRPSHKNLLAAILERYHSAERKRRDKDKQWRQAEELYLAYIKKTDADRVREQKQDAGIPQYVTINIPYSSAILLTAHTYWSSVFLGRDPVFQYDGRHGETQQQVQAVEALIAYQQLVAGWLPPLYQWLLDAGKYGVGILGAYWCEDYEMSSRVEDVPQDWLGIFPTGKTKRQVVRERIRAYSGNKLYNVRPYDFFHDPRVPIVRLQDGEFCGRRVEVSRNYIYKNADKFINLEELEKCWKTGAIEREQGSQANNLPDDIGAIGITTNDKGFLELIEMNWEIIPKEWKLGNSTTPEKWVFTVGGKSVIIGARPAGDDHQKFPFFIQQYEIDAYSHTSRGMLEVTKPLNDAMTWLLNSHFYSVRQCLNGNWIVDPSKVVMDDFSGGPGRLIRLRSSAYGMDVRTVMTQLLNQDPTQRNIQDMEIFEEFMQRITGVTDNVQGLVNAGGRKTATEVRTSTSFGVNRLKTFCEYNSALGWSPLAKVVLQNTQQYMEEPMILKLVGDLPLGPNGLKSIKVGPEEIAGFYDFVPVDGTMPIDRYAQANLWKEVIMGVSKIPQIAMQYDLGGIFSWMAQLAGLKNITQFKLQIVPDQQALAMAADGSALPASQALEALGQTTSLPSGQGTATGNGMGPVQ